MDRAIPPRVGRALKPAALLALLSAVPLISGAAIPDAITADPIHHRVVLENEHVRVFEFRAGAGASSQMHRHPPTAVVTFGRARLKMTMEDGTVEIVDTRPGLARWTDGLAHSWEILSGYSHSFGVEVKAAARGTRRNIAPLPDTDATRVDPMVHNVVFDNDHVRVFEAAAMPGTQSPMHTHPPMVLVSFGTARFELTEDGSSPHIVDMSPGQVVWVPGARHSWRLISGELHAFGFEIKPARSDEG